jgi:hypothetical protein
VQRRRRALHDQQPLRFRVIRFRGSTRGGLDFWFIVVLCCGIVSYYNFRGEVEVPPYLVGYDKEAVGML